jgi:hypothetical protein
MYNIAAHASGGNEDHIKGYFPLVMGKVPLLWLDNLLAECITSWATLSRLFTTNYQTTYNRPGNTHHLTRVWMRRNKTLREYINCYFKNRNTLAGVKDKDVIAYYKKGVTNIKLFEKIHEADAHTITDLMAYVDKLVNTQDAVMHDVPSTTKTTCLDPFSGRHDGATATDRGGGRGGAGKWSS